MYYHCYDERKNNINEQLKCNCNKEMPYVFVIYSHQDSKEVHEIIKELYSAGYNVWFDEGIDPGTEWDEFIASSVKESSFFIAFLSKNYLESSNCKDELNFARDCDIERLLVYLEDIELPAGMQMRLGRLQAIYKNKYKQQSEFFDKLFSTSGLETTKIKTENAEQKYDVYFFRIAEYLMQTGTVSVEKFKERFPLPDQYLKETLEKYEELNLAELNLENNCITVKNNNSNWERKFFEMFEIKKQSSPNLPNEYFTGYNAYLFSYLRDQLFGFDALESKDVFSKKFGKGIISKISYTTKGEPKIEVYFKSGEEKTFYLKNAIDGNCMFIDYIGESDYELIRKYGALIYSENKEELVENFFADEIDFDTSEQIDTSWDISISDYFKEEKYRNIDELRDLLGDFPCGLVSFNIETVEDINDECICILDEQHNFELEETNISESYRAFYSDDEIIESEYVEGKDGEFYEISVLNDWTKDPQ